VTALRVVIADDEPLARRGMRQLLALHEDAVVVAEARNGREAVRVVEASVPDVLLIDIQMPELDGFDVLRQLQPPLPQVIFVTAYDAYAVRAFETHALDYIVKPVSEDRFKAALERARERIRANQVLAASSKLVELLEQRGELVLGAQPTRRLMIRQARGEIVLEVDAIRWIEADDYYAAVYVQGKRHLVRESLDSLERRLDPTRFVRVHRSALVNLALVREVRTDAPAVVVLADGTRVPLSRRRREHVADAVHRFAGSSRPRR
jgi:two-component system, LytTR family, response regulator